MTVLSPLSSTTGNDRGWLVHNDGWLLFDGERTSFAFTRGEARKESFGPFGSFRLEDGREVRFSPPGEKPDVAPLEDIVRKWEAAIIPDGEAVLPPVEIHPSVWAERFTLAVGTAIVFVVPIGMGIAFEVFWVSALSIVGLMAMIATASRYASILRRGLPKALADPGHDLRTKSALEA